MSKATDRDEAKERFFQDTNNHVMTVLKDEGLYRHLRFSIPQSSIYRFDLITWPGYLAITGDMGACTFTRLPDMFEFFRTMSTEELSINPSYWGEKMVAVDRHGWQEFDAEHFKSRLLDQIKDYGKKGHKKQILQEVREEVFSRIDDDHGGLAAMQAAYSFQASCGFTFSDIFDCSYEKPTFHVLWLLWAIAWGIRKYDERAVAS